MIRGVSSLTRFWTKSIRRQLMLGISLVHAVLMTIFIYHLVEKERGFLHKEDIVAAESLADALASNSMSWVLANDVSGLEEVVKSMNRYPSLRYSMVLSMKGRVLAHTDARKVGLYAKDAISRSLSSSPPETRVLFEDRSLIDVATPILIGNRQIGWARIALGQEMQARGLLQVKREGVIYTFLAISIGLVFAFIMARNLARGLEKLVSVAELIRHGRRDVRVELERDDEIGKLGKTINLMLDVVTTSEQRTKLLLDSTAEGIFGLDVAGKCVFCNRAAAQILGYDEPEILVGLELDKLVHRGPSEHTMLRPLSTGIGVHVEDEMFWRRDGAGLPVQYNSHPVLEQDKVIGVVVSFSDITRKKQSAEIIWKQANFDVLTQLPNRHMFQDRLSQEIKKTNRDNQPFALLFIDLDHFKEVNDTLGHHVGDKLLVEAAKRILDSVRETDTVARLGGDEFTIILSNLDDSSQVERIAQEIVTKLAQPFHLGDDVAYVTASLGITLYPEDAADLEQLLKHADQAMYAAKNQGKNRYSYFTPALQEAAQNRLRLINDMRAAISAGAFNVHYQPIIDLASGRICKAEALLRWSHPSRGMIGPMNFIPLAEETGLIHEIGEFVFGDALTWSKRWSAICPEGFQVSVNCSPVEFRAPENRFLAQMLSRLKESGVEGKSIVMEITEGLMLENNEKVAQRLLGFRDAGIQVAIDDFGTGYSSLAYLKRFDIDYLKIDRAFVFNLETDANDRALTEAIIVMAHKLGLKVIAEGIETEGQFMFLLDAGCDLGQGYYFSKPVLPQELDRMLHEGMQHP